jgi:hypothetical protein
MLTEEGKAMTVERLKAVHFEVPLGKQRRTQPSGAAIRWRLIKAWDQCFIAG